MSVVLKRAVGPALVAGVFALLGHRLPAIILIAVAIVLVVLGLAAPPKAERLDRFIGIVASVVAVVVGWVALSLAWLFVVVPGWVAGRVLRRDVLQPRGSDPSSSWAARVETEEPTARSFSVEQAADPAGRSRLRPGRLIPLVVGWIVVALALNYGLGWTYDEFIGSHDVPESSERARSGSLADLANSAAMRDDPWAAAYWEEFEELEYRYEPYVLTRLQDRDGPLVTVEDGVRRSYEPAAMAADVPEVWFFGGATVFGQGQRDDHTIPSAFARRAEQAGSPVTVVNFAEPGHTTWQQWQFFERMLAERPKPDMAVFLGGYDDVRVQLEEPSPDPTHYNVSGADRALTGDPPPTDVGELIEEYQDKSLITRAVRRVQSIIGTAHADDESSSDEAPAAYAADLHARARVFLDYLGERDDVVVVPAWQPKPFDGPVAAPFVKMVERGGDGVVDLSQVLSGRPEVYIDDANINEEGAALVAEALYERVSRDLRAAS